MRINRNNYESWFTDYLDGNLTPAEAEELRVFLLLNEDLAELLDDTPACRLAPPPIRYPRKDSLKKDVLHACPDYYAIAEAEGCLTPEDEITIAKHPDYKEKASLYRKLQLTPDKAVRYPRKSQLYRKNLSLLCLRYASVAVLLLACAYLLRFTRPLPDGSVTVERMAEMAVNKIQPVDLRIQQAYDISFKLNHTPTPANTGIQQAPTPEKVSLPPMGTIPQPIGTIDVVQLNYTIKTNKSTPYHPGESEIFLTARASTWRPSGKNILSDNILTSIYETGKDIAAKIKTGNFPLFSKSE